MEQQKKNTRFVIPFINTLRGVAKIKEHTNEYLVNEEMNAPA